MKTRIWLPVRCCCTPTRIFGFLPVEKVDTAFVTVLDHDGERHRIEIKAFGACERAPYDPDARELAPTAMTKELALYSDDRPMEFWRSIEGFVETAGQ